VTVKNRIAVLFALLLLGLAAMMAMVVPASDCVTHQGPQLAGALAALALYALAGGYVVWSGTREQRMLLFSLSVAIAAGYVYGLSQTLPMVVGSRSDCAQEMGDPQRPSRSASLTRSILPLG
jgi:hypothetical protein